MAGASSFDRDWTTASWLTTRSAPGGTRSISGWSRPTRPRWSRRRNGRSPASGSTDSPGTKAERSSEAYLPRCFVYVDGKPARLPTTPWARSALYTPGQVWCPEGVSRDDVNPRPLSPDRPVQRLDRLRFGRRQGAAGDRLGALPGTVSGRHRLPALRLPDRRPEAGPIEDDPRQDLPDAGRFRGVGGALPPGLPRARPSDRLRPGPARRRRSSSNSAGTSPGRASCGAIAPSSKPRHSTAASSTPRRGRPRGRR